MTDQVLSSANPFQKNIQVAEEAIAVKDFALALQAFVKNRYRPVSVIAAITKADPDAHNISGLLASTIRKWTGYVTTRLTADKVQSRVAHIVDCLRAASHCHPVLFFTEKQRVFARIAEVRAVTPAYLTQVVAEIEAYYKKKLSISDWTSAGFTVKHSDDQKVIYSFEGVADIFVYAEKKKPVVAGTKKRRPDEKKPDGHGVNSFSIALRRGKLALQESRFADAAEIIKEMGFGPFFMITALCEAEPESANPESVSGRLLLDFLHKVLIASWDEQSAVNLLHAFARQNSNSYFIAKGEIFTRMKELGVHFSHANQTFLESLEGMMKEQFSFADWERSGFELKVNDGRQMVWVHRVTHESVTVHEPKSPAAPRVKGELKK
jgi:hypothetical protein